MGNSAQITIMRFHNVEWFIADGFKKRLYFEVTLDNDKRKFPLDKNPNKGELQKFIKMASQMDYSIDATILDKTL